MRAESSIWGGLLLRAKAHTTVQGMYPWGWPLTKKGRDFFKKSLLNLLQYCIWVGCCFFFFYVWFFGHNVCRISAPQPGIEPDPVHWTGPLESPRKRFLPGPHTGETCHGWEAAVGTLLWLSTLGCDDGESHLPWGKRGVGEDSLANALPLPSETIWFVTFRPVREYICAILSHYFG